MKNEFDITTKETGKGFYNTSAVLNERYNFEIEKFEIELSKIPAINEKISFINATIEEKKELLEKFESKQDVTETRRANKMVIQYMEDRKKELQNEQPDTPPKIYLSSETTDITRIFEFAKKSEIISNKTSTNQIVSMFSNLKRENYDKNKSELNKPIPPSAMTETFFKFTKLCAESLTKKQIEELINYLRGLDKLV
jgi:hypothetical protein